MPLSCPFFNSKQIKKGLKPFISTIIQTHGGTCLVFQAYFTTIYSLVKTLLNQEYYNLILYIFLQPFTTFAPFLPLY
nr:MAG TPA: hypothetical protein [Caudoviricetes sp.]